MVSLRQHMAGQRTHTGEEQTQPEEHPNATTHRCPIDGCTIQLPYGHVLCRTHWEMAPGDVRKEVSRLWRRAGRRPGGWLTYIEARQRAIDHVQSHAGRRPAERRIAP